MEDPNRNGGGDGIEPIKKKLKEQIETVNTLILNLARNKDAIVNVLKYLTPPEMYVVMRSSVQDREFAELLEIWKLVAYAKLGHQWVSQLEGALLGTAGNGMRVVRKTTEINYFHLMFAYYLEWEPYTDVTTEEHDRLTGNYEYEITEIYSNILFEFQGEHFAVKVKAYFARNTEHAELTDGDLENFIRPYYLEQRDYIFIFLDDEETDLQEQVLETLSKSLEAVACADVHNYRDVEEDKLWLSGREMFLNRLELAEFRCHTPFRLIYRILQLPGVSVKFKWHAKDVPDKKFIVSINEKV